MSAMSERGFWPRGLQRRRTWSAALCSWGVGLLPLAALGEPTGNLPANFVYLRDVEPSILQDIRYATERNFTSARVPGYESGECILWRSAALALRYVQEDLRRHALSLKVYDCYRPLSAVQAFVAWAERPEGPGDKRYYPRVSRDDLIRQGYIAAGSSHAKGIAVDLTLVAVSQEERHIADWRAASSCIENDREPDNSVDMGTGFDCFDKRSGNDNPQLTPAQRAMRKLLADAMSKRGFKGFAQEWWHFTFYDASARLKSRNFVITAPHRKH